MFDAIAKTYDRANRAMTLGWDVRWRKKVAQHLPQKEHLRLLDCATGTGEQLFACFDAKRSSIHAVGIDLAEEMLEIARLKMSHHPQAAQMEFLCADVLEIPFEDNVFDAITISFGIRNVTNVDHALKEMFRVLQPSGKVLILEGSLPEQRWVRTLYLFYLRQLLPRIGRWVSKHAYAYRYLNETMETFPSGSVFCNKMRDIGFANVLHLPMMFGSVSLYVGEKR